MKTGIHSHFIIMSFRKPLQHCFSKGCNRLYTGPVIKPGTSFIKIKKLKIVPFYLIVNSVLNLFDKTDSFLENEKSLANTSLN